MNAIHYRIVPRDPHAHIFEVSCTVSEPDAEGQVFRLPVWIPGSYLVREFARHFVAVRAECDGAAVAVEKTAKDTWRAAPCAGPISLVTEVYAFDLSVRAAWLDASRGYFNGPSVFVAAVGHEASACVVDILPPPGDAYLGWQVATTLPRAGAAPFGFGRYCASGYDELIDHPVEMAAFDRASFDAGGVTHDIVVSGRHRGDLSRVAHDLKRVCQTQIDLFGGGPDSRAPFDRYLFQVLVLGDGYGGLEHRSSTSLVCRRDLLPAADGTDAVGEDYRTFLGLASHEYFHAWNVKRIKPASFTPYDLTRENYTRQLWAFEGITSYYDDLTLVRSGLIDTASYLDLIGRSASALLRNPGQSRQSVADSSFDAWIKYYRQDENAPNAIVSYYVKGSLIALALDLTLRSESGASLDDVMRALWHRYGETGIGVPERAFEALASEVSGLPLSAFFAQYVEGTAEAPLAALLPRFGISLQFRRAEGDADKGGTPPKASAVPLWIGAKASEGGDLRVQHVYLGGPALAAGLSAGDVIMAIDGLRASPGALQALLKTRHAGERVALHVFRRDELLELELALAAAPLDRCWLAPDAQASPAAIALREAWLTPGRSRA